MISALISIVRRFLTAFGLDDIFHICDFFLFFDDTNPQIAVFLLKGLILQS
jgi:hypothetical protein